MVIYGELFVYGNVTLTAQQKRVAEAREAAARWGRESARRWAEKAKMAAKQRHVDTPAEDQLGVGGNLPLEDALPLLEAGFPSQGDSPRQVREALARHSGMVQEVPVTLHWPLLPVMDPVLRQVPRSRGGSLMLRGVLVPRPCGAHALWQLEDISQYVERSMSLVRFYDFATRRREAAARRGAGSHAALWAHFEHLRQRDARREAVDARWLALGVVCGALRTVTFLCSAVFPAGRAVQDWVADCSALLSRPSPSEGQSLLPRGSND
ncbi:uncharacterized protein LOC135093320 [Scylla paramamosain]|uniref:uncharacterized protein LOC135093320 n=1 Tax=Scylla paramamosain TaxID=85552 RepID=UPI003083D698